MSDIETHIVHTNDDRLLIKRVQDVEPYLEANKRALNDTSAKGRKFPGEFHRVASIPAIVVELWMKEGLNLLKMNEDDKRKLKQKLNDPEFSGLRTSHGRV